MISSKWIAIIIQGLVVFLATQPDLFAADYLIRTKTAELKISILLTPAFAVKGRGSEISDYSGFIPELLAELKTRNGIERPYDFRPANDIGRRQQDGNWSGLIQDVISKESDIGAGPILDSLEHSAVVLLSKPWAKVGLTLVVKKSSNVTSLKEALDRWVTPYVINASAEAMELLKISSHQKSSDFSTLQSRVKPIGSVREGLVAVSREEKSALLLNSEEARYHVNHDFCNLVAIPNFLPLGNYTFAFSRGSLNLDSFNQVLVEMKTDGSLEKLKEKTLGIHGICSDAMFPHPGSAVTFLLAAVVSYFRF